MKDSIGDKIDFTISHQYTLSIRLSTDGFSFSIYNPINDHSVFFFEHAVDPDLSLTANFKKLMEKYACLHYTYKKINIVYESPRYTTVPLEFFEEERQEVVFYQNHPGMPQETVLYNLLRKNSAVVVFGLPKGLKKEMEELLPAALFYHTVTPLCEYFSDKSRMGNNKKMFVTLCRDRIYVVCYERGKLLFSNAFTCKTIEDRLYYLLHIWKQLGFDQIRDEMHLAGILTEKEKFTEELKRFVKQVFIVNIRSGYNFISSQPASRIPFDMQALLLCEL